ncbi:hypothetical protein D3C84_561000 [compost metagenome]
MGPESSSAAEIPASVAASSGLLASKASNTALNLLRIGMVLLPQWDRLSLNQAKARALTLPFGNDSSGQDSRPAKSSPRARVPRPASACEAEPFGGKRFAISTLRGFWALVGWTRLHLSTGQTHSSPSLQTDRNVITRRRRICEFCTRTAQPQRCAVPLSTDWIETACSAKPRGGPSSKAWPPAEFSEAWGCGKPPFGR